MHDIIFYQDTRGCQPVRDYLDSLENRAGKDSRIKYNKILEYMRLLKAYGEQLREPYVKHLDGEIWELRPLRDRILFAAVVNEKFLLLHVFMKDTQKTPVREIEKAKRELADYRERLEQDEHDNEEV